MLPLLAAIPALLGGALGGVLGGIGKKKQLEYQQKGLDLEKYLMEQAKQYFLETGRMPINYLGTTYQGLTPTYQNLNYTSPSYTYQNVGPTYGNVPKTYGDVPLTYQGLQSTYGNLKPTTVDESWQMFTPGWQNVAQTNVEPGYQNVTPTWMDVTEGWQNLPDTASGLETRELTPYALDQLLREFQAGESSAANLEESPEWTNAVRQGIQGLLGMANGPGLDVTGRADVQEAIDAAMAETAGNMGNALNLYQSRGGGAGDAAGFALSMQAGSSAQNEKAKLLRGLMGDAAGRRITEYSQAGNLAEAQNRTTNEFQLSKAAARDAMARYNAQARESAYTEQWNQQAQAESLRFQEVRAKAEMLFEQAKAKEAMRFGEQSTIANMKFDQLSTQEQMRFYELANVADRSFSQSMGIEQLRANELMNLAQMKYAQQAANADRSWAQNYQLQNMAFGQNEALANMGFGQNLALANMKYGQNFDLANMAFGQKSALANMAYQQMADSADRSWAQQYAKQNMAFAQPLTLANMAFDQNAQSKAFDWMQRYQRQGLGLNALNTWLGQGNTVAGQYNLMGGTKADQYAGWASMAKGLGNVGSFALGGMGGGGGMPSSSGGLGFPGGANLGNYYSQLTMDPNLMRQFYPSYQLAYGR